MWRLHDVHGILGELVLRHEEKKAKQELAHHFSPRMKIQELAALERQWNNLTTQIKNERDQFVRDAEEAGDER
jgi:hypothetical protein